MLRKFLDQDRSEENLLCTELCLQVQAHYAKVVPLYYFAFPRCHSRTRTRIFHSYFAPFCRDLCSSFFRAACKGSWRRLMWNNWVVSSAEEAKFAAWKMQSILLCCSCPRPASRAVSRAAQLGKSGRKAGCTASPSPSPSRYMLPYM